MKQDFTFEKVGDILEAKGDGWIYQRVGSAHRFVQTKKLPSLRVIRTLVKELNKVGDTS